MSTPSNTPNSEEVETAVVLVDQSESSQDVDTASRLWSGVADGGLLVFLVVCVVGLTFLLALIPYVGWMCFIPFQLIAPLGLGLWALLRDLGAGRYAPGKRVSRSVIIDARSGQPASNLQCMGRNLYYALLAFFGGITCMCSFMGALPLLVLISIVDGILLATTSRHQRLGDLMVGTRVVQK